MVRIYINMNQLNKNILFIYANYLPGGDPGVQNQKTPTIVLLTPEGQFHSLGFRARDTYHDLDPSEAANWFYFDKFKMALHSDQVTYLINLDSFKFFIIKKVL